MGSKQKEYYTICEEHREAAYRYRIVKFSFENKEWSQLPRHYKMHLKGRGFFHGSNDFYYYCV